jgi:hypothetical protein
LNTRPVETTPGMGEGVKEKDGVVNSRMIYCKNFCKCHSISPSRTIIKRKKKMLEFTKYRKYYS